jgi:hypothetical protein
MRGFKESGPCSRPPCRQVFTLSTKYKQLLRSPSKLKLKTKYYKLTTSKGETMDENMKKFIPLFVLIGLALVAAAIYIIVYHVGMPTRDLSGAPANFWWGLWQGLIIVLSFIASWFDNNIVLYQVNNDGFWYNLGYLIALSVSVGGIARGSRTRGKAKK